MVLEGEHKHEALLVDEVAPVQIHFEEGTVACLEHLLADLRLTMCFGRLTACFGRDFLRERDLVTRRVRESTRQTSVDPSDHHCGGCDDDRDNRRE